MEVAEHPFAPEDVMAYVDRELPIDQVATIEAHLAQCVRCSALNQELRDVSREVTAWEVEPPPPTLRAPGTPDAPARALWRRLWPQRLAAWHLVAAPVVVVIGFAWIGTRAPAPGPGRVYPETLDTSARLAPPPAAGPAPGGVPDLAGQPSRRAQGQLGWGGWAKGAQGQGQPGQAAGDALAAEPLEPGLASQKIVRTATLRVMTADFDAARPAVERILAGVGGFVGQLAVSGERAQSRSLSATVRVPADRLMTALTAFRQLGQVVAESQGADDVTEQMVDLSARLANARNTEKRLMLVLQQRTGKVADVLEVEREIARVRESIERMDADRTTLDRRVTYATITLEIVEPHKAALDLGPITVSDRFRNAAVDGVRQASESALGVVLFATRTVPTLLIWAAIGAWPALFIVRRLRSLRAV